MRVSIFGVNHDVFQDRIRFTHTGRFWQESRERGFLKWVMKQY